MQADAIVCSCLLFLVFDDFFDWTDVGGVLVCSKNLRRIKITNKCVASGAERFVVFGRATFFGGSCQSHRRILWHAFLLFDAPINFECEEIVTKQLQYNNDNNENEKMRSHFRWPAL